MFARNQNLSANLNVMIDAARRAGRRLLRDFGEVEQLLSSVKGPGDFAARGMAAAGEGIREALTQARPAYGWTANGDKTADGKDPTRRWIVDPLGGMANFLHGIPHWAVAIALEHKGEITAGVIFDPAKNELFYAERGGGAIVNDRRLRVSQRRDLTGAIFASDLPPAGESGLPQRLREAAAVLPQAAGMRQSGCPALDLAWTAAGRYDAYWSSNRDPWEVAAGVVLTREAGGFVESLELGRRPHEARAFLAGADGAFNGFRTAIQNA